MVKFLINLVNSFELTIGFEIFFTINVNNNNYT